MKTTINSGPVDEDRAHEIMGKNFFGVYDAVKHLLSVVPTEEQCEFLDKVPFSEETLQECKDTHILVAVFPLSILDIKAMPLDIRMDTECNTMFRPQDCYHNEAFAKDKGGVGWQLVGKIPVVGSLSKTWNDQQAILSKDDETPTARIVVYTIVGHFLVSGERLFENVYVRCVDLDSNGHRVSVGDFDSKGLYVSRWFVDGCSDDIGVSVAKKRLLIP
jgi:hypothetical protein